jgi:adenylosuccinate synthase
MPTELSGGPEDPEGYGQRLRDRGHEFGTTTGRPRRCGWFDAVAARYAHRINRFDALCVTKLDVMDDLEEIRVCTSYRLDGREIDTIPASVAVAERIEPVYESHPGWRTDTTGMRSWDDLPEAARSYLERLGEVVGAPVALVGVGPERGQSILRSGSWLAEKIAAL